MARLVKRTAHGPREIKPEDVGKWVCQCGLSKDQPWCDKSHLRTLDEDESKVYRYTDQGRVDVKE